MSDLIEKYSEELKEDTKLNTLNLMDAQLRLPGIKHKWVSRLIHHKMELENIKKLLTEAHDKLADNYHNNAKVKLSNIAIENRIANHDVIIKLHNKINEQEYIILYLEKVEKIFQSMSFDIKNLVELIKLETL